MNRIEQLRKEAALSQTELAEKLHVHQTAVSQWEKGRTAPSFELICQMAELFDVDPVYLMGNSDARGNWPRHDEDEKRPAEAGQRDELIRLFEAASPEFRAAALALLRSAEVQAKAQGDDPADK